MNCIQETRRAGGIGQWAGPETHTQPEQRIGGLEMSQKKVDRTRDLELAAEQRWLLEIAQNDIEEHNFKNLIRAGIIRTCEEND